MATWGSIRFGQEAEMSKGKAKVRAFTGVSAGKASYSRENSLGSARLNNSFELWGTGTVPGCLVPGLGLI